MSYFYRHRLMKAQFGTYGSLTTAALVSSMRGWEASKHPRHPAGAPASQGGEFAPASYGNSSDPGLNNVLAIARKSAYAKLASGKILRREALNAYMIERVIEEAGPGYNTLALQSAERVWDSYHKGMKPYVP